MNRRQKSIIINFATVIFLTAVAVVAMINFKDYVNRSEAMRAMEQLGRVVCEYRHENGGVPSEEYVDDFKERLEGRVRMGELYYRARWIDTESPPDTILAYTEKDYPTSFLEDGFIVIRLNCKAEWMNKGDFSNLLKKQQTPLEKEIQPK